jgi:hypothetical protein
MQPTFSIQAEGRAPIIFVEAVLRPKVGTAAAVHWLHMRMPGEWLSG